MVSFDGVVSKCHRKRKVNIFMKVYRWEWANDIHSSIKDIKNSNDKHYKRVIWKTKQVKQWDTTHIQKHIIKSLIPIENAVMSKKRKCERHDHGSEVIEFCDTWSLVQKQQSSIVLLSDWCMGLACVARRVCIVCVLMCIESTMSVQSVHFLLK